MRITKVYTRTGDNGMTGLSDGSRIKKNSLRLETYGTFDELNSIVGICTQFIKDLPLEKVEMLEKWCEALQNDLFNLGGDLATPISARWPNMIILNEADVLQLEKMIDCCQDDLPPLREFVLPGGTQLNGFLHLARTVCRRAERLTISLQDSEEINPSAVPYLNRLSDLFFVLSRWVQIHCKKPEITWAKQKGVRALTF